MTVEGVGQTVTVHFVVEGGEGTFVTSFCLLLRWGEGVSWNCGLHGTHCTPTPPALDDGERMWKLEG